MRPDPIIFYYYFLLFSQEARRRNPAQAVQAEAAPPAVATSDARQFQVDPVTGEPVDAAGRPAPPLEASAGEVTGTVDESFGRLLGDPLQPEDPLSDLPDPTRPAVGEGAIDPFGFRSAFADFTDYLLTLGGGGPANLVTAAANAAIDPNTDPLTDRTVVVDGTQYTEREVLVFARAAQAGDLAAASFLNAARTILRSYGFRTGALGTEANVSSIQNIDQRVELLRGDSNQQIEQLQLSAGVALGTGFTELNERYGVFTAERVTRTMLDGSTRSLDIDFADDATRSAEAIGVNRLEALAKTDWVAYQSVLDAGFATPGLRSLEMSGAWRPEWSTFRDFFMQSNDPQFVGQNAAARERSLRQALEGAGFSRELYERADLLTTRRRWWSLVHTRGDGIDVVQLNQTPINRNTGDNQPIIVERFSRELANAGVSQVIQPWMTFGVFNTTTAGTTRANLGGNFFANTGEIPLEKTHRNHLHITA